MLPPQGCDLVEEFLFRDEAFLVEQFDQRGVLPHVGDGGLFGGDDVAGVEGFGYDASSHKDRLVGPL